ncbi:hypothetical protein HG535_0G02570 [Zygotorulaspora mrakii]|uniref:Nudix hydrolase domain-containing protein n=1 Tax=Zygotorulaspora mrakii TaxID=42260 RepID=A0A7H9B802_ZYGMR|nr:uncharacterized protein HG535_0G02570 [Zygotorulaspora mrakii]QLG74374.1 hypothetical protein HG535_0G02570 [Zygotorulaspora mrakii]
MCKEVERTKTARVGRARQVYNPATGARIVAGCLCLSKDNEKVLMISSSKHKKRWIFPKGGVEDDESDYAMTAQRETWEEAGATGVIGKSLGVIEDMRPAKAWNKDVAALSESTGGVIEHPPRSEFHFYEMQVTELFGTYPESHKRNRDWFTYGKAREQLIIANRPELLEALERSSINKKL